jgi:hypothetical protein
MATAACMHENVDLPLATDKFSALNYTAN